MRESREGEERRREGRREGRRTGRGRREGERVEERGREIDVERQHTVLPRCHHHPIEPPHCTTGVVLMYKPITLNKINPN